MPSAPSAMASPSSCRGRHYDPETRHCEERKRRSNPEACYDLWIASLRSQ
jgi:hypothetical protein